MRSASYLSAQGAGESMGPGAPEYGQRSMMMSDDDFSAEQTRNPAHRFDFGERDLKRPLAGARDRTDWIEPERVRAVVHSTSTPLPRQSGAR